MLKKDATEKSIATTYLRCGECAYFDKKRPDFDIACDQNGILKKAIAPTCFVPRISNLKKGGVQLLSVLNLIAGNLQPAQLKTLAALFNRESKLRPVNLSLCQKVFCWVADPNYLSNYYSAYVLGIGTSTDEIILLGTFNKSQKPLIAHVQRSSILEEKDFLKKRDELLRKGKIYDPKFTRTKFKTKSIAKENYEPPTIDMTLEELESAADRYARSRPTTTPAKKGKRTPLVTTVLTK